MSEYSSQETMQQRPNGSSPLAASFLVFLFFITLVLGGFGAYRFFTLQHRARDAALKAEDEAARLQAYKIDAETGELSPVKDVAVSDNADPNRPPDIGDFELTERSGRKVTNKDLLGQPWAVCFVFTRCAGPCLGITAKMAKLQKDLNGAPVRLVTITVDPKHDTPEVLSNYADNFGADPEGWLFLTGEPEYVYKLLRGYFLQLVQEMTGKERVKGFEVLHTDDILHIDAQGRIVKRYHGNSEGDMILLRKALLAEARQLAENPPVQTEIQQPALAEKPPKKSEGE